VRWPRSLRWRLTLAFTAVAGVAVLAASVGAIILVERAVWDPIDAALAEEGETLTELGDAASAGDFSRAVARVAAERGFGDGKFVRMWAADGRVLAASGPIPPALAPYKLELSDGGCELTYDYDTKGERTGITSLLSDLRNAGIRFSDLDTIQSSLEDIFVSLVRTSAAEHTR